MRLRACKKQSAGQPDGDRTDRTRPDILQVDPAWFALVVTLVLVFLSLVNSTVTATDPDSLVVIDQAYEAGRLEESRTAAETALAQDPNLYAAEWMLARVLVDLGAMSEDKDQRRSLFEEAELHARRAVALNPADTWGHTYLCIAVGRLALFHGGKKKIEIGMEVRDEAQRAIELDPQNHRALHVLARWNREVATLSPFLKVAAKVLYGGIPEGASVDKAVDYFQRAIAAAPEHIHHHLELGITYMGMRRYQEASDEFEVALSLPLRDPNDPEYQADATKLLEKARKRLSRPRRDRSR